MVLKSMNGTNNDEIKQDADARKLPVLHQINADGIAEKTMYRQYLNAFSWSCVSIGSSIISYCEQCKGQHTHICIGNRWDSEKKDLILLFRCLYCCERCRL